MTPVGAILRTEIQRGGPVRFHRFMELALYDAEHGYYRRGRDPFGKDGDFYTAEQLQPAFGLLIASLIRGLMGEDQFDEPWAVLELGAGRGEMAEFLSEYDYRPFEVDDVLPVRLNGFVLANEFFDALPVDVVVRRQNNFRLMRVACRGDSFCWIEAETVDDTMREYVAAYASEAPDGALVEVNLDAMTWIDRISEMLESGYLLAIDYGYSSKELVRFPSGTLMSYRKHRAMEDVLSDPGDRDLTAHVNFSALAAGAARNGFEKLRLETMGRMILRAGEPDEFACVLDDVDDRERSRRMLQLKSLMFGMGETFLALLLKKNARTK